MTGLSLHEEVLLRASSIAYAATLLLLGTTLSRAQTRPRRAEQAGRILVQAGLAAGLASIAITNGIRAGARPIAELQSADAARSIAYDDKSNTVYVGSREGIFRYDITNLVEAPSRRSRPRSRQAPDPDRAR